MVFSLNSTFGYNTSRNNRKESDFYDKYWNKDTCNPLNWKSPSTFGVKGAWLVDRKGNGKGGHRQYGPAGQEFVQVVNKVGTRSYDYE